MRDAGEPPRAYVHDCMYLSKAPFRRLETHRETPDLVTVDPSPAGRLGLLVFGMHRSGTSALTGVLERLGVPVAGDLLPAETYNERGIFENRAVNAFHNQLLEALGSRWDDPMPVSAAFLDSPAGEGWVRRLAAIVESELLADSPLFAVKDPRMSRFVPLWLKALESLDVSPRALLPLRHPDAVSASLSRRDGFPRAKTLLLWLDHSLAAESGTRNLPRSVLHYDDLVSDWRPVVSKIASDLHLSWPREMARSERDIDAFLSPDLRHHKVRAPLGDATPLDRLVAKVWDALCALAADDADPAARAALDAARLELNAATDLLLPYVAWEFAALNEATQEAARLRLVEDAVRTERTAMEANLRAAMASQEADLRAVLDERQTAHRRHLRDLDAAHRQALSAERRESERLRAESSERHHHLQHAQASLAEAGRQVHALHDTIARLNADLHAAHVALHQIRASTFWRLTGPLRRLAGAVPPSAKLGLRRAAKAGWWAATPWRTPERLRFLQSRDAPPAAVVPPEVLFADPPAEEPAPAAPPPPAAAARRVPTDGSLQKPLGVFTVPGGPPRVSMVTDSINEGSLFGGVATALIFTALLARRTGRTLRIVTRTQAAEAGNVAAVFRAHGIDWDRNVEFAFADERDDANEIDVHEGELFVTTSWWTTASTRQSVPTDRILYILQEDERMFYSFEDKRLACTEVISDPRIRKVVNSELLHRFLRADGIVDEDTPFFEPAFPERIYHPEPRAPGEKRNFFFYARPNNARNLFERGVAAIEAAIDRGILDTQEWDIHFVGKDLQPMTLSSGVEPILLQNMAWEDYAAYVRSVDLALSLMYTPHPSYPPLDVAACGGVAVTNRFGIKTDLSRYSGSILCVESDLESLVEGLRQGVARAADQDGRERSLETAGLGRNWTKSFDPVLARLEGTLDLVR